MNGWIVFLVACGLIAANFLFQAFGLRAWDVAIERSYLQAVACCAVWAAHFVVLWSKQ